MSQRMFSAEKYAQLTEGIPSREYTHHDSVEEYIDSLITEYDMHEDSIRPHLLADRLIIYQYESQSFRFAVSGDINPEHENPLNQDTHGIHVLATIRSKEKAMFRAIRICADLRTARLRHSGRCLRITGESNFDTFKPDLAYVYIAFFDIERHPPKDGV